MTSKLSIENISPFRKSTPNRPSGTRESDCENKSLIIKSDRNNLECR